MSEMMTLNTQLTNMNGITIFHTMRAPITNGEKTVRKQYTVAGSKVLTLAIFPVPKYEKRPRTMQMNTRLRSSSDIPGLCSSISFARIVTTFDWLNDMVASHKVLTLSSAGSRESSMVSQRYREQQSSSVNRASKDVLSKTKGV